MGISRKPGGPRRPGSTVTRGAVRWRRWLQPAARRGSTIGWQSSLPFIVVLACVAIYTSVYPIGGRTADGSARAVFAGQVTRIVDGDTFYISGQAVRIRLWGLDAPEAGAAGGSAATAALARLIGGQVLTCRQRDIDHYGRMVGQCSLQDGRDVTAAMIAGGTTKEFCRYSHNHYGTCGIW